MRRSTRKQPSNHSSNSTKSGIYKLSNDERKSKSFVPKRAIGSLIVCIGVTALVLSHALFHSSFTIQADSSNSSSNHNESYSTWRINPVPSHENLSATEPLLSPTTGATLHTIFSTDCSSFQHWQSYLFFHSAFKVSQPGYITRIASGCTDEEIVHEKQWHEEHIQSMSRRFRIHFTPHFSGVKDENGEVKGDYKYFNKPFGLKHFLENSQLMGMDDERQMKHPDVIVILCDPDFLLLRPITDDFSNERETIVSPRRKRIFDEKKQKVVTHGNPYAQTYGLGVQWRSFHLDEIAGADSPAKEVDQRNGQLFYPAGPPYIGTAADMHKIANKWSEFAPRVHKEYPHLLAEMYAYCIAAAHLQLPHTLIDSLMVSSAGIGGEGWRFVNAIPSDQICRFASHPNHSYPLPSVIHFCQRYLIDKYFWGKRKVPHDIFTCEAPLLIEPPSDVGSGKYLTVYESSEKQKPISAEREKMDGFMLCALTAATNDAMNFFKDRHCDGDANRAKTYDMRVQKDTAQK